MPESVVSSESMCACPRVIQVMLEKENSSFGFTVRGGSGGDEGGRPRPLTITHVRPGGPTDREGTIKPGDRLVAVDGVRLARASLHEAHRALTAVPCQAVITVEYDVSVMDAVRAAPGPLLVELENAPQLGLTLSTAGGAGGAPLLIESIRQASIAERVGALHVGDQVLAIDDVSCEGMSTAEATRLLCGCAAPLLRLEIVPATARRNTDVKRCKATLPPSLPTTSSALSTSSCGSGSYNPLGSLGRRRQPAGRPGRKHHRGHGDGSSGAGTRQDAGSVGSAAQYAAVGATLCHQETVQLSLLADSHGFGLSLTSRTADDAEPGPPLIGHIEPGSPADRCGVLHVGDRLLEVNHQSVESAPAERAALLLAESLPGATLLTEFDVADAVVPSSGTFLVKLVCRGPAMGLTLSAPKSRQLGEPLVVADVEPGSVAHRNGTIEPGDRLLSIDGVLVERASVQEATERLHSARQIVTLRVQKDNLWSGGLAGRTGALHTGDRVLAINGVSLRGRTLSEASQQLISCSDTVRLRVAKAAASKRGRRSPAAAVCREPPGSALASVDSAVESWDSASAELPRLRPAVSRSGADSIDGGTKAGSGSAGDRDSGGAGGGGGERWESSQRMAGRPLSAQGDDTETEDDWNKVLSEMQQVESFRRDFEQQRLDDGGGGGGGAPRVVAVQPPRQPNWTTSACDPTCAIATGSGPHHSESEPLGGGGGGGGGGRPAGCSLPRGASSTPEFRLPAGSYTALSRDSRHLAVPVQIHRVTLFKDAVYEDFGFSVSNALYEKGVYVNRMKPGGPADKSGILRPHDRILQVNGTMTEEHDSCHIVPLIASVGDRLELVVARNPLTEQRPQLEDSSRHPWVEEEDKLSGSPEPAAAAAERLNHVL